jgi:hypothetical protein
VSASVGPAGEAIALWSGADESEALRSATVQPGWATFPDPRTPRPVTARVTVHRPNETIVTDVPELNLAHPRVQPLPDSRVLIVATRCRWRTNGPDLNAIILEARGRVIAEHTIGDGIENVLVTASGQVWVSYFDEGVYGNYGWGEADTPAPIGASGRVRFSPDLEREWSFPGRSDDGWEPISDCYALNVTGEDAWICYYGGFPVVRVHNGTVTGWHNHVAAGVRALAVSDTHVALYGGYGPDADRLAVARLGPGQLTDAQEYRVVRPDGSPMPPRVGVVGRDALLHFLTEDDWSILDLTSGQ